MEGEGQDGARRLSSGRRLLFTGVALLLPLLVLELSCRLLYARLVPPAAEVQYAKLLAEDLGPGFALAYRPHPYTCYEPTPGFAAGTMRWHTDDGFRLPEMRRERTPGVTRIACMGGSTTYEPYVPVELTYCAYLEEYLNRRFPGHKVEVLNAGVGAYNSQDTFARFHYKVLDYAPDLVVNYDGINDVWPMLAPGPFENDLSHARKVMEPFEPPSRASRRLASLCATFRVLYFRFALHGRIPSIMDLTYKGFDMSPGTYERASTAAFRRNLEDTAFICRGRGIELVLSSFAADPFQTGRDPARDPYAILMRGVDDLNVVARDVAAKIGLPLVDLDGRMPRNVPGAPEAHRVFSDICHTTPRGNRVKANLVGAFVAGLLERRLGVKAEPFELDTAPRDDGRYPPAVLAR